MRALPETASMANRKSIEKSYALAREQYAGLGVDTEQALKTLGDEQAGRRVEIDVGALPECEGDPVLLLQVWINLLSNALKYTRQNETTRIEVGSQLGNNGEQVYYVKDNGVGFDMLYADKLFGVFQRLHREEDFEGTGIGLAIAKRIIERHGGRIWADAQPEQGATFYFTLP